jgi:hypothetical protein
VVRVCILSLPRDLSRLRSVSNSNTPGRRLQQSVVRDGWQPHPTHICIPVPLALACLERSAVQLSYPICVSGMEQGVCKSWMRSTSGSVRLGTRVAMMGQSSSLGTISVQ